MFIKIQLFPVAQTNCHRLNNTHWHQVVINWLASQPVWDVTVGMLRHHVGSQERRPGR